MCSEHVCANRYDVKLQKKATEEWAEEINRSQDPVGSAIIEETPEVPVVQPVPVRASPRPYPERPSSRGRHRPSPISRTSSLQGQSQIISEETQRTALVEAQQAIIRHEDISPLQTPVITTPPVVVRPQTYAAVAAQPPVIPQVTPQAPPQPPMATISLQDLVKALTESREKNGRAAEPEKYDGTEKPGYFIKDCEMFFADQPGYAATVTNVDHKKIRFVMTHTKGRPHTWCRTKFTEYDKGTYPTWDAFKTSFASAFQKVDDKIDAQVRLESLKPHDFKSINDYNVEFNRILEETETSNADTDTKVQMYYVKGLPQHIAEPIYTRETAPATLTEWQTAALRIDNRRQALLRLKKGIHGLANPSVNGQRSGRLDEPMDIDAVNIQNPRNRNCYNCGGPNHIAKNCTAPKRNQQGQINQNRQYQPRNTNYQPRNSQGQFQRTNQTNNRANVRNMEIEDQKEEEEDENPIDIEATIMEMPEEEVHGLMARYLEAKGIEAAEEGFGQ